MSQYTHYLADVLARQNAVIHRYVDDLTQEETLAQPAGGNNMNWVLGHLAAFREHMLSWIGVALPWEAGKYARFDRGSAPLTDSADAADLALVLADLDRSAEMLVSWLRQADETALAAPVEGTQRNLGDQLGFYIWHDGYHVGQLEVLRHVAGRHESLV